MKKQKICALSALATQATSALQIETQDFFDGMAPDFGVTRGVLKALTIMAARGALISPQPLPFVKPPKVFIAAG